MSEKALCSCLCVINSIPVGSPVWTIKPFMFRWKEQPLYNPLAHKARKFCKVNKKPVISTWNQDWVFCCLFYANFLGLQSQNWLLCIFNYNFPCRKRLQANMFSHLVQKVERFTIHSSFTVACLSVQSQCSYAFTHSFYCYIWKNLCWTTAWQINK